MILVCKTCKKEFKVRDYRKETAKFCSYKCYWNYPKTLICPDRLKCSKCGSLKDKRFFYKSRNRRFGRKSYCSSCSKKMYKDWLGRNYNELNKKRRQNYVKTRTPEGWYAQLKHQTKNKNLEFSLSLEELKILLNEKCFYCGDRVETLGLDRIDSSKGYIRGNLVRACYRCNVAKNNMSVKEFINHCKKIVDKCF